MFTLLASRSHRQQGDGSGNEDTWRVAPKSIAKTLLRLGMGIAVAGYVQWRNSIIEANEVALPPDSSFIAVDNRSLIYKNDNFLSADEVAYILQFIDKMIGWGEGDMENVELPREGYVSGARKDPIFARIEERIANHTGIAVHPHEDILSIHRFFSNGDRPRGGYFPPLGLVHDSHKRPHRAWTMIVYLEVPEEGGRWIFPLAGTPPKDGEPAERHREFVAALQDLFGGEAQNFSRRAFFDVHSDHPFMDLIEESCRGEYGASFLPIQPGAAILYPSNSRSWRTWRAGCNVIKGMQTVLHKFKEYPLARRKSDEPLPDYDAFRE